MILERYDFVNEKAKFNSENSDTFDLYVIPFFAGVRGNALRFMRFSILKNRTTADLVQSVNAVLSKTVLELRRLLPIEDSEPRVINFKIQLSQCSIWYTYLENSIYIGLLKIKDKLGKNPDIDLVLVLRNSNKTDFV